MITILDDVAQFGFAVGIAIYMTYWITTKLSKQLCDLSNKIDKLNTNIEKLTYAFEVSFYDKNTKKFSK